MVQREKLDERKLLKEIILAVVSARRNLTVKELVSHLRSSLGDSISLEEIHNACKELEFEGVIRLNETSTQTSFFNNITRNHLSSVLIWLSLIPIAISLVSVFLLPSSLGAFSMVANIACAIAIFLVPGYGLVGLILPQREMISKIERIGLGLVMSVVLVPILWLVFDWLPTEPKIHPVIYLSIISLSLVFASAYRQFLIERQEH